MNKNQHIKFADTQVAPLFQPFGLVVLVIAVVFLFLASQVIGVYIASGWVFSNKSYDFASRILMGSENGTVVAGSIIICALIMTAFIFAIIKIKGRSIKEYLAFYPFRWSTLFGLLGLLFLFLVASETAMQALDVNPMQFVDALYATAEPLWLLVFAMVVVAPLYEELIFRGLLWTEIRGQVAGKRGVWLASVVSSVLFAVIHLQYDVYGMATITLLALLFCYARVKSGTLWVPILIHMVNNAIAMWQYVQFYA